MHNEAVTILEAAITQLEQAILALQKGNIIIMSQQPPIIYNVCLRPLIINLKQEVTTNYEAVPNSTVKVTVPPDTSVTPTT